MRTSRPTRRARTRTRAPGGDERRETAAQAQAEAERIRKRPKPRSSRLEAALGQIGETRRTALGLVMNLGSDHLKFEFDKADLRPEDKELLSRIAGILLTSHDYTISVNGHTDDVGDPTPTTRSSRSGRAAGGARLPGEGGPAARTS